MTKNSQFADIAIPLDFQFNQVKPELRDRLNLPFDFPPSLGALSHFTGTWSGAGFNLIFRPQSSQTPTSLPLPAHGPDDNILELNLTTENLAFSQALGSVPNRGMVQGDIFLNGVPYLQTVSDVTEVGPAHPGAQPVGIHVEPGIWMAVPATSNPSEPATLVRMGSIPHGTTILLQGTSSALTAGPPVIPVVDPTPLIGGTSPFRFPSQTASDNATFRLPQDLTPHIASGRITHAILDDPNTVLRDHIAHQTIVQHIRIDVASAPISPPGPLNIPDVGGGADNIAFLVGQNGQPNADIPVQQPGGGNRMFAGVRSTFWIETVEHLVDLPVFNPGQSSIKITAGSLVDPAVFNTVLDLQPIERIRTPVRIAVRTTQIQYSQVVLLNFRGVTWPHVSVATLTPALPVVVPPSAWRIVQELKPSKPKPKPKPKPAKGR